MISEYCILLGVWLAKLGLLLGTIRFRNWRIDVQKLRVPVGAVWS
jgi:hypothetical protein